MIRKAKISDVKDIQKLLTSFASRGQMLSRSLSESASTSACRQLTPRISRVECRQASTRKKSMYATQKACSRKRHHCADATP